MFLDFKDLEPGDYHLLVNVDWRVRKLYSKIIRMI